MMGYYYNVDYYAPPCIIISVMIRGLESWESPHYWISIPHKNPFISIDCATPICGDVTNSAPLKRGRNAVSLCISKIRFTVLYLHTSTLFIILSFLHLSVHTISCTHKYFGYLLHLIQDVETKTLPIMPSITQWDSNELYYSQQYYYESDGTHEEWEAIQHCISCTITCIPHSYVYG